MLYDLYADHDRATRPAIPPRAGRLYQKPHSLRSAIYLWDIRPISTSRNVEYEHDECMWVASGTLRWKESDTTTITALNNRRS